MKSEKQYVASKLALAIALAENFWPTKNPDGSLNFEIWVPLVNKKANDFVAKTKEK